MLIKRITLFFSFFCVNYKYNYEMFLKNGKPYMVALILEFDILKSMMVGILLTRIIIFSYGIMISTLNLSIK